MGGFAAGARRLLALVVASVTLVAVFTMSALAQGGVMRLGGADRYETMSSIADAGFDKSAWAVLATGDNYPDALAASSLAGAHNCPVILTHSGQLSDAATEQLIRMGTRNVLLMGGPAVFGDGIVAKLINMGISVTRVAGKDRCDTSVAAMRETRLAGSLSDAVIVTTGETFADSLSVGPWSCATWTPVVLTKGNGQLTKNAVKTIQADTRIRRVIIIGGTKSVSGKVESQLGDGYTFERIAGADRYETSSRVAAWATEHGLTWSRPAVATGKSFPDALAGAALCGANSSPLLLVGAGTTFATDLLREHVSEVETCYILGGKSSVGKKVEKSIKQALGISAEDPAQEPAVPAEPEVKPEPDPEPAPTPEPTPEPKPEPKPEPSPIVAPEPEELPKIRLTTSDATVLLDGAERQVFYAQADGIDGPFTLSSETGDTYADMYDDGDLKAHGDEIAGDGIYSCLFTDFPETDSHLTFVVKSLEGVSNLVTVGYFKPFSELELEQLEKARTIIDTLVEDPDYWKQGAADRKKNAEEMVDELIAAGYVVPKSVHYDDRIRTYSFTYTSGVLGAIATEHPSEGVLAGTSKGGSSSTESYSQTSTRYATSNSFDSGTVGKALILNAFPSDSFYWESEKTRSGYRSEYYEELSNSWNKRGLTTTLKDEGISVDDFRNLAGYDVVCISTHGTRHAYLDDEGGWETVHEYSAICTGERTSTEKDAAYAAELKDHQIIASSGSYDILPQFFIANYPTNALRNEFVFAECCQFMGVDPEGSDRNWDRAMAEAIVGRGATACVGYHNNAYASYSRDFMKSCVNNLLLGKNIGDAFDAAKSEVGDDSDDYYTKKRASGYTTYPGLIGSTEGKMLGATAYGDVANGGFEQTERGDVAEVPKSWKMEGDVRSLSQLGSIVPNDQASTKMAMISTGIGSKTTAELGMGTEGSRLSQRVLIPSGKTKLTFDYDFVSEEPMEYVGTSFDDSFAVSWVVEGETNSKTLETINSAEWEPVEGFDFAGGDVTAFHTGWKSHTLDVSPYKNKVVTIQFTVYDVGDSIYDSAAILDNVRLS